MANPPRKKGTAGEGQFKDYLNARIGGFHRTAAGTPWDLEREGDEADGSLNVLATRPDRGQWLVLMTAHDFTWLLDQMDRVFPTIRVEVKRRKTYAHHSLFEQEVREWGS